MHVTTIFDAHFVAKKGINPTNPPTKALVSSCRPDLAGQEALWRSGQIAFPFYSKDLRHRASKYKSTASRVQRAEWLISACSLRVPAYRFNLKCHITNPVT
jgi:hypothetical protein